MNNKNAVLFLILLLFIFPLFVFAQNANITLRNGKIISGKIVEEKVDFLILNCDLGQLNIDKKSIETISYTHLENTEIIDSVKTAKSGDFSLKDPVVVYFKTGEIISGILLAKSLDMVIIKTETGRLTVNKKNIQKIEYISSEYSEKGGEVLVSLTSGEKYQGTIYFEDSNEIVLETDLGRLAIPKNNLYSIEYTAKKTAVKTVDKSVNKTAEKTIDKTEGKSVDKTEDKIAEKTVDKPKDNTGIKLLRKRPILPRYDVIDIGYSSDLGTNFGPGYGLGYHNKFSLAQLEGLDFSFLGGLSFTYFKLSQDIAQKYPTIPGNYKGGAFTSTLGLGGQINVYPATSFLYGFYIAPMLELHYIYRSMEENYPSFPQYNENNIQNLFKFGLGVKFGIDFSFGPFVLGLQYNMHYIFGTDGFNQISITFLKKFF